MRNSSLVEWLCAENLPGLSIIPKLRIKKLVVGERSKRRRSHSGSGGGVFRSENAGVSSEMMVRIHHTVRPRIPGAGSSALGKSGPKMKPTGIVDGQPVEIPVPAVQMKE